VTAQRRRLARGPDFTQLCRSLCTSVGRIYHHEQDPLWVNLSDDGELRGGVVYCSIALESGGDFFSQDFHLFDGHHAEMPWSFTEWDDATSLRSFVTAKKVDLDSVLAYGSVDLKLVWEGGSEDTEYTTLHPPRTIPNPHGNQKGGYTLVLIFQYAGTKLTLKISVDAHHTLPQEVIRNPSDVRGILETVRRVFRRPDMMLQLQDDGEDREAKRPKRE
jgi:hypothetical protein